MDLRRKEFQVERGRSCGKKLYRVRNQPFGNKVGGGEPRAVGSVGYVRREVASKTAGRAAVKDHKQPPLFSEKIEICSHRQREAIKGSWRNF